MKSTRKKTGSRGLTGRPTVLILLVLGVVFAVSGCSRGWIPEEDSRARKDYAQTGDGNYRVRRGDSLYAIAFNYGLDWRDVARWNGIEAPYVIHPDQLLRLTAPARSTVVTTRAVGPGPSVSERDAAPQSAAARTETAAVKATKPELKKPAVTGTAVTAEDPTGWKWPVEGRLLSSFKAGDPSRNGIEIAGEEGRPIVATASGEVVYSGNGLIGYGELIIIKHSERMLSAYAHNRERLVVEGQKVSAGERIAHMGRDERNRAMLHFEIRRNGTPQDPLRYLPRK